jgi:Uma2 family endonuclease
MVVASPLPDVLERQRRITVDEYHRMIGAGIPEYWIANLAEATVEVHREPDRAAGSYRVRTVVPAGETLAPAAVPGVRIDVGALFR